VHTLDAPPPPAASPVLDDADAADTPDGTNTSS
jgi:hypothetical protein